MSTKKEYRTKLRAAAQERLDCLALAKSQPQKLPSAIEMEGLWLGNDYVERITDRLQRILNGQPVDYAALADAITLEMIANSNGWNTLRYYARRLGWLQEEKNGG